MQNLLRLIIRFSFQIIFVILEIVALTLVFQKNPLPHARLFQFTQEVHGFFFAKINHINHFIHLKDENYILANENAHLRNELSRRPAQFPDKDSAAPPASLDYMYDYIPARVVNNSTNKQNNYITLNVGYLQGVRPEMGVVGTDGIVGVVRNVSDNFSTVMSVLNSNFKGSVKLKSYDLICTLTWPGHSYREALVTEVPGHAPVYDGDTIITSGFSTIFPPGEMVGRVIQANLTPAGSFKELKVSLNQDFKRLSRVYVIRNFTKVEQINLELKTYD